MENPSGKSTMIRRIFDDCALFSEYMLFLGAALSTFSSTGVSLVKVTYTKLVSKQRSYSIFIIINNIIENSL